MKQGDILGGRYELLDSIGAGGMGVVWRARHTVSRRVVALKVIRTRGERDGGMVRRFQREASAAAEVGHPGLVEVFDAGVDDNEEALFIAMELLTGETLGTRLWDADVSTRSLVGLLLELLDALAALHSRGFVHRDIKPDNVFIAQRDEGGEQVKLLDFGLARSLDPGDSHTRTGTSLGTPHYMAPEQAMSAKSATPAADVWSVGIMLYEILAGRRPFDGETPHAVVMRACSEPHPPLAEAPSSLARLVDRCLAKKPEGRPADATALRNELEASLTEISAGEPIPRRAVTAPTEIEYADTLGSDPSSVRPRSGRDIRTAAPSSPIWVLIAAGLGAVVVLAVLSWQLAGGTTTAPATVTATMTTTAPAPVTAAATGVATTAGAGDAPATSATAAALPPPEYPCPDSAAKGLPRGFRPICGPGWRYGVPANWERMPNKYANVVSTAADAAKPKEQRLSVKLVIEPFGDSLSTYVNLSMEATRDIATVHYQGDADLGGFDAVEVERTFNVVPPWRVTARATVISGQGWVFHCSSLQVDRFAGHRLMCKRILDSLRIGG